MSVLSKRDFAARVVEQPAPPRPNVLGQRRRPFPLVIDERRGVEPGALLRIEGDIGPGLMRMSGEKQAMTDAESGVVRGEPYRCERIPHRSGKSGEPIVEWRYAAPADPPVPGLTPMVRSTIFTWR